MTEEQRGGFKVSFLVPVAIVVAGILIAGAIIFNDKSSKTEVEEIKGEAKKGAEDVLDKNEVVEVGIGSNAIKGNKDAKITIVEFSDYECPFCKKAEATMKKILKDYEGKIRWAYRDFTMSYHKDAQLAAEASKAANAQGKYWEYHDLLYENNDNLKKENLIKFAEGLNLNMEQFKKDLEERRYKKDVEKDLSDGEAARVDGTPTFFINGRMLVGAQPYEEFARIIDEELGENR